MHPRTLNIPLLRARMDVLLGGHLLNPLWLSREERRTRRGEVTARAVGQYLDKYAGRLSREEPEEFKGHHHRERIFSLWLQGEEAAPPLVRACLDSIRERCTPELVVLDEKSLFHWIAIPDFFIDKYRKGMIRPAHLSDICRIELLYRYGGYWMDATDYATGDIPEEIRREPFFVYRSGHTQRGSYSFIQNCFIRGTQGNFLLQGWRRALREYWKREKGAVDYFVHQLLFRKFIESNELAAGEFGKMLQLDQDPTHQLWFAHGTDPFDAARYAQWASQACFQKTEYKSRLSVNPPKGSFADALLSGTLHV